MKISEMNNLMILSKKEQLEATERYYMPERGNKDSKIKLWYTLLDSNFNATRKVLVECFNVLDGLTNIRLV